MPTDEPCPSPACTAYSLVPSPKSGRTGLVLNALYLEKLLSNFRRFAIVILFVGMWLYTAPKAWGVGFQPVSPEELKMSSEPLAPGAPAIILYRQVDRDDNSRTSHEDNYFRIKVLTEAGRKYADIEIPFLKQREDIVNIRVDWTPGLRQFVKRHFAVRCRSIVGRG